MKVKIFTEGGKDIGLGHISRCISLYDLAINRGVKAELIVFGDSASFGILNKRNYRNENWYDKQFLMNNISENDYVIVDSYKANFEIYEIISQMSKKAMYIDDIGRLSYPNGIVVNPALDTSNIIYQRDESKIYLLGPSYIILREPFIGIKRKYINENIQKCLILMGGNDIRNLLPLIITKVCKLYPDIKFNIIIGNISKELEEILNSGIENINIHININADEVKKLMLESDFAITAAGQTILELLATSTPFIPIQVIDNQKFTASAILKKKLVRKVLSWESCNIDEQIIKEMELFKEQKYRKLFIDKYSNFIDGKGAQRIIDALMG